MTDITTELRDRADSYRLGGPSSEHTAVLLERAALEIETLGRNSNGTLTAIFRERLKAIIDWADLAMKNAGEFDSHGVRNLDGPVFDAAREALASNPAPQPRAGTPSS